MIKTTTKKSTGQSFCNKPPHRVPRALQSSVSAHESGPLVTFQISLSDLWSLSHLSFTLRSKNADLITWLPAPNCSLAPPCHVVKPPHLGETCRPPSLKVVFLLLGISISLLSFDIPPMHLSSSDTTYFTCMCVFNLPFKWKLHKGSDFCALVTVGSLAFRTELAHSRCPVNIYGMNKRMAYRVFLTWPSLGIQSMSLAHTLGPATSSFPSSLFS